MRVAPLLLLAACGTAATPPEARAPSDAAPVTGPQRLAPATGRDLAIDGEHLYWIAGDGVRRVAVDGGAPSELLVAGDAWGLQVDDRALYHWAPAPDRRYQLWRLDTASGARSALGTFDVPPRVVAQDAGALYATADVPPTETDGLRRFVVRIDKESGATTRLGELPRGRYEPQQPQQLVVADDQLYLTTGHAGVLCFDRSRGTRRTCVADVHALELAHAGGRLWWWGQADTGEAGLLAADPDAGAPPVLVHPADVAPLRAFGAGLTPGVARSEEVEEGAAIVGAPGGVVAAINRIRVTTPAEICGSCVSRTAPLPAGRLLWLAAGGGPAQVVAEGTAVAAAVADQRFVYWLDPVREGLYRAPLPAVTD